MDIEKIMEAPYYSSFPVVEKELLVTLPLPYHCRGEWD